VKLFLTALMVLMTACHPNQGTDTGNPENSADPVNQCDGTSSMERCLPTPYVKVQVAEICKQISNCSSKEVTDCYDRVWEQTGLSQEFNLAVDTFKDLDQLAVQKKINVSSSKFGQCLQSVKDLTCDSEIFKGAYDLLDPENYSHVHQLLRADESCQQIYSMKETP
jgi:hypothetical protein